MAHEENDKVTNHIIDSDLGLNEIEEKVTNGISIRKQLIESIYGNKHYMEVGSFQGGQWTDASFGVSGDASNNYQGTRRDFTDNNGQSYDYEFLEKQKRKYGNDYRHILDCNNFDTSATIDLELSLESQQSLSDDGQEQHGELHTGIEVMPIKNQMNLFCYIPPKCGRNTFASFSGKTGFLHQRGFSDTTLSFGYHMFGDNALLCDWHTVDGTSKVCQTRKYMCIQYHSFFTHLIHNLYRCHVVYLIHRYHLNGVHILRPKYIFHHHPSLPPRRVKTNRQSSNYYKK